MEFSEIIIYSDQPTICPKCGTRSEILNEFENQNNTQIHVCMNTLCEFEFVMEMDDDFAFEM